MVRDRTPVSPEARAAIANRIHRDDCARAIVHLVERPAVASLYLGSDEAPTPMGEILDWIAARLGIDSPPSAEHPDVPLQRGGNKRIRGTRLAGEGFRFLFPSYREGFGSLLEPGIPHPP
jgi:nucleoside-diphosphate-sugar epimerase